MNTEGNNFGDIYVLLHISKTGALLLWNPAMMEKRFIQTFKGAKLGEWYRIDKESGLVAPTSATCDTKVDNGVVKIKAPLVFFEDAMFRNIVGYSPGFGRVGCFVPTECNKEKMYNAWIAYMEFVENSDFQSLLVLFDVVWTLDIKCKPEKIAKTDMHYLSTGRLRDFEMVSGIVVEKVAPKGKIFNTEDDICDFDVSCAGDLQLGVFVKFVPVSNFSMTIVAVDAHSVIGPKNVQCISVDPNVKLNVSGWSLNGGFIKVPGLSQKIVDEQSNSRRKKYANEKLTVVYDPRFKCFTVPKSGNSKRESPDSVLSNSKTVDETNFNDAW